MLFILERFHLLVLKPIVSLGALTKHLYLLQEILLFMDNVAKYAVLTTALCQLM